MNHSFLAASPYPIHARDDSQPGSDRRAKRLAQSTVNGIDHARIRNLVRFAIEEEVIPLPGGPKPDVPRPQPGWLGFSGIPRKEFSCATYTSHSSPHRHF